jgi:hypothetical protein
MARQAGRPLLVILNQIGLDSALKRVGDPGSFFAHFARLVFRLGTGGRFLFWQSPDCHAACL